MLMYLSILDTQDEKEKFTEVYEQYQHFCWYVANQMLGDDHLAEDAVQETFLALTRHLDKIEVVESSKTRKFLMTIVKSKAIEDVNVTYTDGSAALTPFGRALQGFQSLLDDWRLCDGWSVLGMIDTPHQCVKRPYWLGEAEYL